MTTPDNLSDDVRRLLAQRRHMRGGVTFAVKELNKAAHDAGVQDYQKFHEAGYKGLYGIELANIKKRKGMAEKESLLDRASRAELAANEFRLTQAEEKIKRDKVMDQRQAISTHRKVARAVRATIRKLGGVLPEDLPIEESIKKIAKEDQ